MTLSRNHPVGLDTKLRSRQGGDKSHPYGTVARFFRRGGGAQRCMPPGASGLNATPYERGVSGRKKRAVSAVLSRFEKVHSDPGAASEG
jgi:hypothetical protein